MGGHFITSVFPAIILDVNQQNRKCTVFPGSPDNKRHFDGVLASLVRMSVNVYLYDSSTPRWLSFSFRLIGPRATVVLQVRTARRKRSKSGNRTSLILASVKGKEPQCQFAIRRGGHVTRECSLPATGPECQWLLFSNLHCRPIVDPHPL